MFIFFHFNPIIWKSSLTHDCINVYFLYNLFELLCYISLYDIWWNLAWTWISPFIHSVRVYIYMCLCVYYLIYLSSPRFQYINIIKLVEEHIAFSVTYLIQSDNSNGLATAGSWISLENFLLKYFYCILLNCWNDRAELIHFS